jgi:hypothetical protein
MLFCTEGGYYCCPTKPKLECVNKTRKYAISWKSVSLVFEFLRVDRHKDKHVENIALISAKFHSEHDECDAQISRKL